MNLEVTDRLDDGCHRFMSFAIHLEFSHLLQGVSCCIKFNKHNSELQFYFCMRSDNKVTSIMFYLADNNMVMVERVGTSDCTQDCRSCKYFVTHSCFVFVSQQR
jgi:hypothetical protein